MDIWLLLLFVGTEFMFSLSPGPAVAAVVSSSMIGGYRLAISAILGVLIGNLIYFVLSAVLLIGGTSVQSGDYFDYIKIAGSAYLVYILYKEYASHWFSNKGAEKPTQPKADNKSRSNRFFITLVMQLSNPKTIVFFAAFLPQFINNDYNLVVQFVTLACLSFMTEFVVLMAYAAGGKMMLKYGSEKFGGYAHHLGNAMMAFAVIWSLFR